MEPLLREVLKDVCHQKGEFKKRCRHVSTPEKGKENTQDDGERNF